MGKLEKEENSMPDPVNEIYGGRELRPLVLVGSHALDIAKGLIDLERQQLVEPQTQGLVDGLRGVYGIINPVTPAEEVPDLVKQGRLTPDLFKFLVVGDTSMPGGDQLAMAAIKLPMMLKQHGVSLADWGAGVPFKKEDLMELRTSLLPASLPVSLVGELLGSGDPALDGLKDEVFAALYEDARNKLRSVDQLVEAVPTIDAGDQVGFETQLMDLSSVAETLGGQLGMVEFLLEQGLSEQVAPEIREQLQVLARDGKLTDAIAAGETAEGLPLTGEVYRVAGLLDIVAGVRGRSTQVVEALEEKKQQLSEGHGGVDLVQGAFQKLTSSG